MKHIDNSAADSDGSTNAGDNSKALEFTRKVSPAIREICLPLLSIEIPLFTYARIFNNGKRIHVSNDQAWVEHYIQNNYQNNLVHLPHYIPESGIKYALWSESKVDPVFSAVYDKFHYWYGISFYEKHHHYIDYFDFGSYKNNHKIIHFYFNNLKILSDFIQDFKCKTYKLVESINEDNLLVSNIQNPFVQTAHVRASSLKCDPMAVARKQEVCAANEMFDNAYLGRINFTKKESEILFYLLSKRSLNDIARFLNLTVDAVRFYVTGIKLKTNSMYRGTIGKGTII